MPGKSGHDKHETKYAAVKDKGMSDERAANIANFPRASSRGGKHSSRGGTTAPKKAGRKGAKAAHR